MKISLPTLQLVFFYSDVFFYAFVLCSVLFLAWAASKEYYREAARRVVANRWACVCLGVVALYMGVAFLDSLHFRPALRNRDGSVRKSGDGVVYGDPLSVFDVLLASVYPGVEMTEEGLRVNVEKSYSRPFAAVGFDKEKNEATGTWEYMPLRKPRCHWWGTDKAGGDLFYKLLKGIRTALVVGLVTTMIVIPFAIFFGVTAGYFGGRVDDVIQFVYVTLGSIPSILLISAMMLIVRAKVGTGDTGEVFLRDDRVILFLCAILGLIGWSSLCRLLRAETMKLRELDYVKAARAMGVGHAAVILKHIVPNLLHVVLIASILRFSGLVMVESILAYIKIGVPSTVYSWGRIVDGARSQLGREPIVWWPVLGAFLLMFFLVFSINIIGDAVRDALDPKLRT